MTSEVKEHTCTTAIWDPGMAWCDTIKNKYLDFVQLLARLSLGISVVMSVLCTL